MSGSPFRVVLLDASHDRSGFHCGSEALDGYFQRQVSQDIRRRVTTCFVALSDDRQIGGFYTLASASVPLFDLPEAVGKKLPRYPSVPAVRLGRLAVSEPFKGQGLGGALLADALVRAARSEIAAYALIVEAKDDSATAFYRHHGFIALPDTPQNLFLPLAGITG